MSMNPDHEDELEIRGRMDIEDIVKYQINRCNISSTDPNLAIFNSNVLVLLDILPAHKRQQVLNNYKEYTEEVKVDARELYCGVRVGKPRFKKERVINPHLLYRMVLDAFADSGLTWKIEPELKELGKVMPKPKPTPYFGESKSE